MRYSTGNSKHLLKCAAAAMLTCAPLSTFAQGVVVDFEQFNAVTYILFGFIFVVMLIALSLIRKLYRNLTHERLSRYTQREQMELAVEVGGIMAFGYNAEIDRFYNINGYDGFGDTAFNHLSTPFEGLRLADVRALVAPEYVHDFDESYEDVMSGKVEKRTVLLKIMDPATCRNRYFENTIKPVHNTKNGITELICVQKDVTDQVKKDREKAEISTRFSSVFNNNVLSMVMIDKHGFIIDMNETYCRLTGITNREEVLEMSVSLRKNPCMAEDIKDRILSGEMFSYVEEADFSQVNLFDYFKTRRNDKIVMDCHVSPIYDINGNYNGSTISYFDITKKDALSRELEDVNRYQDMIFKSLNTGLATFESDGRLRKVNDALCEMLGLDHDYVLGEGRFDLFKLLPIPEEYLVKMKAGESGEFLTSFDYESFAKITNIEKKKFNKLWLSVRFSSLKTDGQISTYVILISDITQFHNQHAQLEKRSLLQAAGYKLSDLVGWSYALDTKQLRITIAGGGECVINDTEFRRYVSSESESEFFKFIRSLELRTEGVQCANVTMRLEPEGEYHDLQFAGGVRPIVEGETESMECVGYVRDATIYNRDYKDLKKRFDIMKVIVNNMHVPAAYADLSGKILWENVSKFFPKEDVGIDLFPQGHFCYESHGQFKRPCHECLIFASANDGKSRKTVKHLTNGSVVSIESAPVINDKGKIIGIALNAQDITEITNARKQIESLKVETVDVHRLIRSIIDCIPASLFIKDARDNFRYVVANDKFCELMGHSEEDLIGKNDFDLVPKDLALKYFEDDKMTAHSGRPFSTDYNTKIDGVLHFMETTKTFVKYDDGREYVIGFVIDHTEIKQTKEALRVAREHAELTDKLKSAFIANISHELRTPLNAVVGFSQLLQDTTDKEELAQYIQIISSNNELLLRVIDDVMELSKIDAGIAELKPEVVDVQTKFEEFVVAASHRCANPNVRIMSEHKYESCVCRFDLKRMTQVCNNFIDNALKFTQSGYIKLGYDYRDKGIFFSVEDTGIGIEENKQKRIFNRFEKLDRFAKGNGLGLSICKAIVDMMGGRIGFRSKKGHGSFFWAWVPVEAADVKYLPATSIQTESPTEVSAIVDNATLTSLIEHKPKLLIVEDDKDYYLFLNSILVFCDVDYVSNGKDAVDKVANNKYDAILMDLRMPMMDGLEATKRIRAFNANVPIIAVTANVYDSDCANALEAGCTSYLPKPVTKATLLNALASVLNMK